MNSARSRSPYVRRLTDQDADDVAAGFRADPEMQRQGDVSDHASATQYIRFITDSSQANIGCAIAAGNQCLGVVAVNGAAAHRLGWFFYWLHPDYRGRGVTSRAAAALANWALEPESTGGGGFDRLELGHRANNPASGGVARAAGFIGEGRERQKFLVHGTRIDALTYGRLATDPVPDIEPLPMTRPQTSPLSGHQAGY